MNPLRIFRRLRHLEVATEKLPSAIVAVEAASAAMIDADRKRVMPCARCGAVMDIAVERPHGPRVIERVANGKTHRVVVCSWCRSALTSRSGGWALAKEMGKEEAAS